jgi:hypothetical protein
MRSPQIDCDADDRAPTSTDFRRGLACARSPAPSELALNVSRSLRSEAGARNLIDELQAWSLVLPQTAAFTHLTAAELNGWWLPDAPPHPVFAAMRKADPRPRRSGLYICRHPKPFPMTITAGGLKVTTPAEHF